VDRIHAAVKKNYPCAPKARHDLGVLAGCAKMRPKLLASVADEA
jgi:hypothetical protein